MRREVKEWLALMGRSILVIVGLVLTLAALVELSVGGPWFERGDTWAQTFERSAGLVLLLGLALCVPPLALAFREAVRAKRS